MSCRQHILDMLTIQRGIVAGGVVEDTIRDNHGYKADNVGRRCRELVVDGKIRRWERKLDGKVFVGYSHKDFPS